MNRDIFLALLFIFMMVWTPLSSAGTVDEAQKDIKGLWPDFKKYATFERSEGPYAYQAIDVIREGDTAWYLIIRFNGSIAINTFFQKEIDYGDNYREVYFHGIMLIENVSSYGGWHEYKDCRAVTKLGVHQMDPLDIWDEGIQKFKDKYRRLSSLTARNSTKRREAWRRL